LRSKPIFHGERKIINLLRYGRAMKLHNINISRRNLTHFLTSPVCINTI
jgi:hypothetical protein